jgi:chromosomal replication initiation ATPase DnaA
MQLAFDLPHRVALSRADFLTSDSNATAVGWIDRCRDWPSGTLALHGPAGCGKTHLVNLWCAENSGIGIAGEVLTDEVVTRVASQRRFRIAIDNADRASERPLLHIFNLCLENRGLVLLASRHPPASWRVTLPDLDSRLRAVLAVGIGLPDDALLEAVLVKHFADRQLRVAPGVVAHLTSHMERSFAAAAEMAARLDLISLRDRRAITVPLARRVLLEEGHFPPARDAGVT